MHDGIDTHPPALQRWQRALLIALLCGYALLVYGTAWLSDDAFISLRTAANALAGEGLRWNPAERVQTFTHPLWLAALISAHAVTGEPFYSTLVLSLLMSCAAASALVLWCPGGFWPKAVGLVLACCSKAFVDYSSSGLENPLTHLLLALFVAVYVRPSGPTRLGLLAAIAGMAALNRLDTILLYAPALAACCSRATLRRDLATLALATTPLLAWEAFSFVYYGFLWPNTAYAKLGVGSIAGVDRLREALQYFRASLERDPLTLVVPTLCALAALRRRDRARLALLAGAGLYFVYVLRIGGDFMAGRFFSAPFWLAIACFTTSRWLDTRASWALFCAAAAAAALAGAPLPPFAIAGYGVRHTKEALDRFGIHDARAEFFLFDSLTHAHEMNPGQHADHPWTLPGRQLAADAARSASLHVAVIDAIGHAGYYAGPRVHIVDRWALADPLLARLPAQFGAYGHYPRALPDGYLATLRSGQNQLTDPNLAAYYDDLSAVVRGPLFSAQRWRALLRLHGGVDDRLLDAYAYVRTERFAPRLRIVNPGDSPGVAVYVWNDLRVAGFVLDASSKRGKSYELRWRVTPAGAALESPPALPLSTFAGLRPRGMFTVSVAFHPELGKPASEIYELRYYYRVDGRDIVMLREPWPSWNAALPSGEWHDAPIDSVMRVLRAEE